MPDPIPTNSSTPPVLPNVIPSDSSLPPVLPVERSRGPVQKYPPPPGPIRPYASLGEMKAAHTLLQRRRRGDFAKDPTLSGEIAEFLYRGHATGALIGSEDERYHAQGLLTYWSNILYRRGGEVEDDSLARFDATRAP
ncbi:MAG: hypothetical protein J2P46_17705, partial [Zavarzinella sp.]|nr:hypothetical protein [Zavarzinella sp.]